MILGDSVQVMVAEGEGLGGKVQCSAVQCI
jgi:hypothetical protein